MRRSGRTQAKSPPWPQRMDFGQGSFASAAGSAAGIRARADIAGTLLFSTQKSPSLDQLLFRRVMLAQEAGQRLFRRARTGAALGELRGRHVRRHTKRTASRRGP